MRFFLAVIRLLSGQIEIDPWAKDAPVPDPNSGQIEIEPW